MDREAAVKRRLQAFTTLQAKQLLQDAYIAPENISVEVSHFSLLAVLGLPADVAGANLRPFTGALSAALANSNSVKITPGQTVKTDKPAKDGKPTWHRKYDLVLKQKLEVAAKLVSWPVCRHA